MATVKKLAIMKPVNLIKAIVVRLCAMTPVRLAGLVMVYVMIHVILKSANLMVRIVSATQLSAAFLDVNGVNLVTGFVMSLVMYLETASLIMGIVMKIGINFAHSLV